MNREEMKLRIIEVVADLGSEAYTNALYEVIVNGDLDYIPNIFNDMEEFFEFIEKWTPKKCCVKEEDND